MKRILGKGTFGTVLQCYDSERNENVAIKVVRAVDKYKQSARFEITILKAVSTYSERSRQFTFTSFQINWELIRFSFQHYLGILFASWMPLISIIM